MRSIIILLISLFYINNITAQDIDKLKQDINYFADIVANAMEYEHKIRANKKLVPLVEEALEQKVDLDFTKLKWISKVTAPDSIFTILTWPVQTSESSHTYNGYVLYNNSIIKLDDQSESLMDNIHYLIGDKDNWFGQQYYAVKSFESKGESKYVLFGYNAYTQHENIKIADIVYFDQGEIVFGQQLFASELTDLRDAKNRVILKYSDDAPVNLNYNPGLEMIVYDHLVPRMGQLPGQGLILTGDGSYEGYQLNEGIWIHKEKLFDHIYEEAPRPNPVLEGERSNKKDLFGKSKGDNKN